MSAVMVVFMNPAIELGLRVRNRLEYFAVVGQNLLRKTMGSRCVGERFAHRSSCRSLNDVAGMMNLE